MKVYDNKLDNVNKRIMELSNIISNIKDNINKLNAFKEKTKKKF